MVEVYTSQPFEQRKSQNLTFMDYAKDKLLWGALPFMVAAATFTIGRLGKNKIWPLDGSPTLLYTAYEKVFVKGVDKVMGVKAEIDEVERLALYTSMVAPEKRLGLTRDIWNAAKGLEIGAIPVIYHFWRNKEKHRLDLEPVHDRLQKLQDMKPSDSELAAENASLQNQLDFVQGPEKPFASVQAVESQHQGKVTTSVLGRQT